MNVPGYNEATSAVTYMQFQQPWFAPPSWLFGPVWSVLYVIIIVSFGYTVWLWSQKKIPSKVLMPFIVNIVSNVLFTPIQFGLQNNLLALIDIIVVLFSIMWCIKAIWHHKRWVAYAQIPYLLWVSFATVLQASITWLNW